MGDYMRNRVGNICKKYREQFICDSLMEYSRITGINYKTLWSFEHGESSNIKILLEYMDRIPTWKQAEFNMELLGVMG